jgi:branched-chain amino acid transport system permease protein
LRALVDLTFDGVTLGALYALFAAGLSLIFGVMRLVNLAHGDLIVLAAYLILVVAGALGVNPAFALALAAPLMAAAGYLLQRWLLNRVLGPDVLPPLLATFGLSIVVQNVALAVFSADTRRISLGGLEGQALRVGPFAFGVVPLMTFAAAVVTLGVLHLALYRTAAGAAFRAVSDDPEAARLVGVDNRRQFALAMALAMLIATIAAFFLGARANFDPTIGPGRLVFAFEAVVIGGLGSLWGTLVGGIALGLAQSVGAAIGPQWQLLAGHLAFLAALYFRPRGLFPGRGA